jgi:hypothetical protein
MSVLVARHDAKAISFLDALMLKKKGGFIDIIKKTLPSEGFTSKETKGFLGIVGQSTVERVKESEIVFSIAS